jgi:hypothetical protein
MARVRKGTQWGFINDKGLYVINPQFDQAHGFIKGLSAVKKGTKWGFINESGNLVINCTFSDAEDFSR